MTPPFRLFLATLAFVLLIVFAVSAVGMERKGDTIVLTKEEAAACDVAPGCVLVLKDNVLGLMARAQAAGRAEARKECRSITRGPNDSDSEPRL